VKLAIEFVDQKTKERFTNWWKDKGLDVEFGSMGSTWVYDLSTACYDGRQLDLYFIKNDKLINEVINQRDILYFEIHKN